MSMTKKKTQPADLYYKINVTNKWERPGKFHDEDNLPQTDHHLSLITIPI